MTGPTSKNLIILNLTFFWKRNFFCKKHSASIVYSFCQDNNLSNKIFRSNPPIRLILFSLFLCMLCFSTAQANDLSSLQKPNLKGESGTLNSSFNSSNNTLTLAESVRYGLENNPRIQAAQHSIQKAASEIGVARSQFLPSMSMNLGYNDLNNISMHGPSAGDYDDDYIDQVITTGSLQATQTLFAGLTIFNSYQKAKLGKELAKVKKNQEEMRLILDIQTHFLKYLKARGDVQSLRDTVKRLKVNVKAARSFYEHEMAPYVHVLQAEVDLADAQQKLSKAKNTVETEKVHLYTFLNLPVGKQTYFQGDLKHLDYKFTKAIARCLQTAFDNRPEIKVGKKSLSMAEEEVDIALGQFSPKLQLSTNYNVRDTDYDNPATGTSLGRTYSYDRDEKYRYWSVALQLKWPFFEGGKKYYQYSKAKQEVARLHKRLLASKNQVRAQVRTNYMSMLNAADRIDSTKKAIQEAKESYHRSNKRYRTKMGSLQELLDSQIRLTRAEMNHNQALMDYQLSLARLFYAMGVRNYALNTNSD